MMEANLRGIHDDNVWYDEATEFEVIQQSSYMNEIMYILLFFFPHIIMITYGSIWLFRKIKKILYNKIE